MTADIRMVVGSISRVACLSSSRTDACARATVGLVRFISKSSSETGALPIAFLSESPKTLRAMATPPCLQDFPFDFVGHTRNGLDRALVSPAVYVTRFDFKDALLRVRSVAHCC